MTPCSIRTSATCQAPLGTVDRSWHGGGCASLEAVLGNRAVCSPLLPRRGAAVSIGCTYTGSAYSLFILCFAVNCLCSPGCLNYDCNDMAAILTKQRIQGKLVSSRQLYTSSAWVT